MIVASLMILHVIHFRAHPPPPRFNHENGPKDMPSAQMSFVMEGKGPAPIEKPSIQSPPKVNKDVTPFKIEQTIIAISFETKLSTKDAFSMNPDYRYKNTTTPSAQSKYSDIFKNSTSLYPQTKYNDIFKNTTSSYPKAKYNDTFKNSTSLYPQTKYNDIFKNTTTSYPKTKNNDIFKNTTSSSQQAKDNEIFNKILLDIIERGNKTKIDPAPPVLKDAKVEKLNSNNTFVQDLIKLGNTYFSKNSDLIIEKKELII